MTVHPVVVRASFIVEDGDVRQPGRLSFRRRGYRCSVCGEKGHSARTCEQDKP